ncbi:hypothetical protein FNV43_RR08507 [Rhamnella rubrinervis]|uniref:Fe2OG dioxygenase domain-containing protein n=1 Tax=Rhamnella rubrinervis TaxID=2594499 RepID=A0A8K0MJ53_9ROSA|nr:hypothetical protein FNV43_RR08507 [Rhamnella rubrinervis]
MEQVLKLPILDLSSPDRSSIANCLRQEELIEQVLDESSKFFSLPLEEKMKLLRKGYRGYTPLFAEKSDPQSTSKGDSKESYSIGPLENMNQWPSQGTLVNVFHIPCKSSTEILPCWRATMESFYSKILSAGKRLLSLVALALNLNEDFFETTGALDRPTAVLRLLHYPAGEFGSSDEEILGASAHSDYGMVTLLICREKSKQPLVWEDVPHINGAFIVNIGDMMERWTNCLLRSTLHRVIPCGQERYSLAFFLDPNEDCVVECIESCCNESSTPRFPPIRSGDYLKERLRLIWGS